LQTDFRTALFSFFRVGQPGGKSLASFDELMQALEEDQAGPNVEWKKVFEEDREFNQGEFAEATRDQFLQVGLLSCDWCNRSSLESVHTHREGQLL
jgi:hypothetical protein